MLDLLRTRLARIDERKAHEIDRDIDEELALHLEQLESDLIESGLSPAAARERALLRFGDPRTHRRHCRDVALRERRMKTYAQIVVTAGCGLLLAAVSTSLWFNQQSANAALVSMNDKMADLANAVSSRAVQPANGGVQQQSALIYITGDVTSPGQFVMPAGGVSLRRMLAMAGVNEHEVYNIYLSRRGPGGPERTGVSGNQLRDDETKDMALQADDLITVVKLEDLSNVLKLHQPAHVRKPRAGEMLFVTGDVRNPGQYSMPANGITLRRLLAVAGVDERTINHVVVTKSGSERTLAIPGTDIREKAEDVTLEGGELVKVVKNEDRTRAAASGPAAVVDPVSAVEAVEAAGAPKR